MKFLSILCISISFHIVAYIFLYNNRTILDKQLYCNVNLDPLSETSNGTASPTFKVTLEQPNGNSDQPQEDGEEGGTKQEDESKSPAGKFSSSYHANKGSGEQGDLIQRLHQSLDLKNDKPIIRGPDGKLYSKDGKPLGKDGGAEGGDALKGEGKYPLIYDDLLQGAPAKQAYMFRKRQYQDIVVKEVLPSLYTIDKPFRDIVEDAPTDLKKHNERNQIIHDFKIWSNGDAPDSYIKIDLDYKPSNIEGKSPLKFSSEERRKYFDDTLTLPKDLQLSNFIKRYLQHHDPNSGDLPLAVRELYYENLQRLAYDFSGDKTYFMIDYFQENLNKEDFLKHALSQISRLKGTKTGTELLFTIDNIYEIQQRAIRLLLDFIQLYPQLPEERKKRLGTEVLHRVAKRYQPILSKKGIYTYPHAINLYSHKRIEILDYLITNTPNNYRLNDAFFEKGATYWNLARQTGQRNFYAEAFKSWKAIRNTGSDKDFLNKESYARITSVLQKMSSALPMQPQDELTINQALDIRFIKAMDKKKNREDRLLWP